MEKQIVLFDIDGTLLDGSRFYEELFFPDLIKKLEFTQEEISKIWQEYKKSLEKNTDFNPEEFIDLLAKSKNIDLQTILDIFYTPEFFSKSLFPEVGPILTELQEDFVLGIFSEGFDFWQGKKLDNMGIKNYFEQNLVFIERRKTALAILENLPEGAIVVDNSVDVIRDLLKFGKVTPVWINRVDKPIMEGVEQIKSLVELPALLEKLT